MRRSSSRADPTSTLKALLRQAIAEQGPLRFSEYQELCLYHPEFGFYGRGGGAGRAGRDFLTSPEVGPLFGAVVGDFLDAQWTRLGEPDPFVVVECGAGRGALAIAVRQARPRCSDALAYVMVERSDVLRATQTTWLPLGECAQRGWSSVASMAELPRGQRGVVLANELLDNLCVDVAEAAAGGLIEWRVSVDDETDGFGWVVAPASADFRDLAEPVSTAALGKFPVATHARSWVADARRLFEEGVVVAFDYGADTNRLATRGDWLRTYAGHVRGSDPFDRPGSLDITVDVPWEQLAPEVLVFQCDFLREYGIDRRVTAARELVVGHGSRPLTLDVARARSAIAEAEALLAPKGLGGFHVAQWACG